ncbi:MAG: hypothetical protein K2P70_07810 [Hyphomonadaceae bacterium]|nr:hypothetical protein [Hyphomonadaceae bacterium]
MKLHALLLAAALALAACGTTQRALRYDNGYPDADVFVDNQRFQLWFHESDQTILIQRGDPQPLGSLLAQNATIYANDRTLDPLWWGAAANAVLTQFGCYGAVVSREERSHLREVSYTCREPVDVAAQVAQRRAEWRRGVHVPAPPAS